MCRLQASKVHVIESITLSSSHVPLPSLHLTQSVLLNCINQLGILSKLLPLELKYANFLHAGSRLPAGNMKHDLGRWQAC